MQLGQLEHIYRPAKKLQNVMFASKAHTVGVQYAVGVNAKRSYGWWGPLCFSAKRSTPHAVGMQYAVGTQYAVGVSAKRSPGTVELANMGGGDRYL